MNNNYLAPDYASRAADILRSDLSDISGLLKNLELLGFSKNDFAHSKNNGFGEVNYFFRNAKTGRPEHARGSVFKIKPDETIGNLEIDTLTEIGGNPILYKGRAALDFFKSHQGYDLISQTSGESDFRAYSGSTVDVERIPSNQRIQSARFHFDLPQSRLLEGMPIEVFLDYVPNAVNSTFEDACGNEEALTHPAGIYVRARQTKTESQLHARQFVAAGTDPKAVYDTLVKDPQSMRDL